MKKSIFLRFAVPMCLLAVLVSCIKRKPNVAPDPDKEFQSAVDVSYAALVISDVEMACSFVAEADLFPKFYMHTANSPGPTIANRTPNGDFVFVTFNNTKCLDGHVRNGTIAMYTGLRDPNARYYHNYDFQGKVSLLNYRVDNWSVDLKNTFLISNLLASPNHDPGKTNLSWSFNGDFILRHNADSTKNMHCNVDLVKTLVNTADKNVYNPNRVISINWTLAVVKYDGTMFGETSRTVPFKYTIREGNSLVRDFSCYPDKLGSTSTSTAVSSKSDVEEFHPFKDGRVTFVTNDLYPRDLSYGNEQSPYHDVVSDPLYLTPQCDNKGVITIKGISYPLDFAKEYK